MTERRRGQWPVAAANGIVGATVLLLVAVLALVVSPPAPPGIAAFAPQANKPITDAPLSQSSQFGEGDGECAVDQVCEGLPTTTTTSAPETFALTTSTTAKTPPRGVPSSLQCYTWPDGTVTQTFDPQSPPCIATWDDSNGNGGATSPGVTASEIRVALPVNDTSSTWPNLEPIVNFFNTRFQLYGRKIRIVDFISQQASAQFTGDFNVPEMQRADATQITELDVFATTDFVDPIHYSWSLPVFRDILTRNRIVSIHGGEMTPHGSAADLLANAPYEWTYYTPIDGLITAYAEMVCRQLVGKPASHAPDPAFRTQTRKFAVLVPVDVDMGGSIPGLDTLLRTIDGCGVKSPKVVRYATAAGQESTQAANLNELRSDGVNSLLFFPRAGAAQPSHPMNVATNIRWEPEWVTIGWNNYLTASTMNANGSGPGASFGVAIWNKMPPLEQDFWHRAFLASGGDPVVVQNGSLPNGLAFYNEMLLLATGIQMAGPNLTPETFADGLRSTKFPNPGAAGPPFYQGTVGFGPNDITMVDDYVPFWLDTRMTGAEVTNSKNLNTSRAYCYVALGRRYRANTWPTSPGGYYAADTCR